MKEWAKSFYKSQAWKRCRAAYAASVGGLCERCLSRGMYTPGVIVHHKIVLTPDNISDPSVTLNWDYPRRLRRQSPKCQKIYGIVLPPINNSNQTAKGPARVPRNSSLRGLVRGCNVRKNKRTED